MINKEYLAIIGLYQGTKWLDKIITALENQTIQPSHIVIWNQNQNYANFIKDEVGSIVTDNSKIIYDIINCKNYGVYARFSAGLLYNYDRILVLDDDTIPGCRWVENCYNTIDQVGDESIIGYRGIKLHPDTLYDIEAYEKGTKEITRVSLCGHSWFLKRKHILALFEDIPINSFNGEDSHLSAINQIKYNTKTYVPKQLLSEPDTWGSSMQHLGALAGRLSTSLGTYKHLNDRKLVNEYWIQKKGWII